MNKHILVVDDDHSIVKIVRGYLEQAGYEVMVAFNGSSALEAIWHHRPALVILDLMLPDRDGWDITRELRGNPKLSAIPIIMLTARVEDSDKIIGLELGADDYMTKPFNPREVVARVRALLRRSALTQSVDVDVINVGPLALDLNQHRCWLNGKTVNLTPTEFKLLKLLMENPGHTFSREEMLEKALGYGYEGFGRTLDTHIRNLRKKIELDPRNPTLIQTVYSIGYRLTLEQEAS